MFDSIADPVTLSRMQFAANITFHILFPSISIALCWFLLFFKLRFNSTGDQKWHDAYYFWVKVFALTFAMGVVSGITMSFQFGTNWPGFMMKVGNIAGPLLAYEVMTAFFLEATFLGIMLFGKNRVSDRIHTLSVYMVAIGTTLSAFWILVLNSWMQVPVGFEMRNGQAFATDWMAILFSPSLPLRLAHMLIASGLTVSFLIAGISAYRWLSGIKTAAVMAAMRTAVVVAAVLAPTQIVVGDFHGLVALEHQPAKIAAIEAVWHTEKGAPLVLFAVPNEKTQKNDFAIEIPHGASLILTHEWDGELKGLSSFDGKTPPVRPVFYGFRIMVGIGVLMLLASWIAVVKVRRGEVPNWVAKFLVAMTFSGWLATVAGWIVTEVGRQPYLVYGVLTTAEAATDTHSAMIVTTLLMYLTMYVLLAAAYITVLFHMARKNDGAPAPKTPAVAGVAQ